MDRWPEILETCTPARFAAAVARAADALRAGEVVALPTETVYGLAANAFDPKAVARIFSVKGRPAHNPIIVHVADVPMARRCVAAWPAAARRLAAAFWPGPLTLVLPKSEAVPELVTGGGATVGVRWPSHPFMQAVIRECGFPLAAPSANPSGRLSPTNADHVAAALGDRVRMIVDGGQCQVGIESTVLDLAQHPPCVLRPGIIHSESLVAALGETVTTTAESLIAAGGDPGSANSRAAASPMLRSPGQLPKHYAPRARLRVAAWANDSELQDRVGRLGGEAAGTWVLAHTRIPGGEGWAGVSVIPRDSEAFARALYAELHRCDAPGVVLILVEAPPAAPEWAAVADRLQRAAADESIGPAPAGG